jgi:hypothetical protein
MARNRRNGEPWLGLFGSWAVLAASFALSADTWILLAQLAGFTRKLSIPDTDVVASIAWLMPICVDGYVVVALTLWMSPVPARVARFAKYNTYIAAGIGIASQAIYHLLTAMATATQDWQIVLAAIVGAFPPALAGLSIHMRALIRRESNRTGNEPTTPAPSRVAGLISTITQVRQAMAVPVTAPTTVPAPTTSPVPTAIPSSADRTPAKAAVAGRSAVEPIPTPAEVAERITSRLAEPRPNRNTASVPAQRVTRPRTNTPKAAAAALAPSSTDSQVAAKDAVQPAPLMADPAMLVRVAEVARQYRAEHGSRITPGQLAVRLKVNTPEAAQLLHGIDDNPTTDLTVNGRPVNAVKADR